VSALRRWFVLPTHYLFGAGRLRRKWQQANSTDCLKTGVDAGLVIAQIASRSVSSGPSFATENTEDLFDAGLLS
jgi:hypothetical protein